MLYDSSLPFEASVAGSTPAADSLVLQFPKKLLPLRPHQVDRLLAVPLPAGKGIGRLHAGRGWSVDTLQEARGVVQEAVGEARGDRSALLRTGHREQRLAQDDARCQNRSDLAAATRAARTRVQDDLPKSSRERASLLKRLRAGALRPTGT
ncbi:hypothetical protein ABTY20_25030 [Streptomyces sp. NPDC126497]|uniref:hypothetical protein n=1 Tax=Streptomyces sp. NPDC126497 TaxID=3155313 RepID=UPI0033180484